MPRRGTGEQVKWRRGVTALWLHPDKFALAAKDIIKSYRFINSHHKRSPLHVFMCPKASWWWDCSHVWLLVSTVTTAHAAPDLHMFRMNTNTRGPSAYRTEHTVTHSCVYDTVSQSLLLTKNRHNHKHIKFSCLPRHVPILAQKHCFMCFTQREQLFSFITFTMYLDFYL